MVAVKKKKVSALSKQNLPPTFKTQLCIPTPDLAIQCPRCHDFFAVSASPHTAECANCTLIQRLQAQKEKRKSGKKSGTIKKGNPQLIDPPPATNPAQESPYLHSVEDLDLLCPVCEGDCSCSSASAMGDDIETSPRATAPSSRKAGSRDLQFGEIFDDGSELSEILDSSDDEVSKTSLMKKTKKLESKKPSSKLNQTKPPVELQQPQVKPDLTSCPADIKPGSLQAVNPTLPNSQGKKRTGSSKNKKRSSSKTHLASSNLSGTSVPSMPGSLPPNHPFFYMPFPVNYSTLPNGAQMMPFMFPLNYGVAAQGLPPAIDVKGGKPSNDKANAAAALGRDLYAALASAPSIKLPGGPPVSLPFLPFGSPLIAEVSKAYSPKVEAPSKSSIKSSSKTEKIALALSNLSKSSAPSKSTTKARVMASPVIAATTPIEPIPAAPVPKSSPVTLAKYAQPQTLSDKLVAVHDQPVGNIRPFPLPPLLNKGFPKRIGSMDESSQSSDSYRRSSLYSTQSWDGASSTLEEDDDSDVSLLDEVTKIHIDDVFDTRALISEDEDAVSFITAASSSLSDDTEATPDGDCLDATLISYMTSHRRFSQSYYTLVNDDRLEGAIRKDYEQSVCEVTLIGPSLAHSSWDIDEALLSTHTTSRRKRTNSHNSGWSYHERKPRRLF